MAADQFQPCRRPVNARKTGRFADGIITVGAPLDKIGMLFDRFAEGAGECDDGVA